MDMERIIAALVATGHWEDMQARRGFACGFRCEYCDKNLLADADSYMAWTKDHLIPLCDGGTDTFDNIAIACHNCNAKIKMSWNPASECGLGADRSMLIASARAFVARRRQKYSEELSECLSILNQ